MAADDDDDDEDEATPSKKVASGKKARTIPIHNDEEDMKLVKNEQYV